MHKQSKRLPRRSLRKNLIFWILLCVLPILAILFAFTALITRSYEGRMRTYAQQMIGPFAAEIDTVLSSALRYVGSQDLDLSCMNPSSQATQLELMSEMQALGDTISNGLSIYTDIDAVFLYNDSSSSLWFVHNTNRSYAKNQQAADYLETFFSETEDREHLLGQGYRSFSTDTTCYLYIASEMSQGMIGCWFEEQHLLHSMTKEKLPGMLGAALSDESGVLIGPDSASSLPEGGTFSTRTFLTEAPFSITVCWDEAVLFSSFRTLVAAVVFCLCLACFLFALCLFALRRSFIQPLDRLSRMIGILRKNGFAKLSLEETAPQEIQEVVSALNLMVDEMKDLKIQVYEEQLKKQQTEMQLYQLQLRPHFLLNMLNNLISYAQMKDFPSVKKLAMFLSSHCRYILYNTWFVTVEEELVYTQNYFDMQTMHSNEGCRLTTKYDNDVLDLEIPILCIQVFVENSLKCALPCQSELEIRVSLDLCSSSEGEACLRICIDDTGPGFSGKTLQDFQKAPSPPEPGAGHGIGIFNVRERFMLLYGDNASVLFSNNDTGGAHVELLIPTEPQRRKI